MIEIRSMPYREALRQLPGSRGDAILEIRAGLLDQAAQGLRVFEEPLCRVRKE